MTSFRAAVAVLVFACSAACRCGLPDDSLPDGSVTNGFGPRLLNEVDLPSHDGGAVIGAFTATTGCLLFRPASAVTGVLGHDGTYSLPLDGGRTLWVFGDTFTGHWSATGERVVTGGVHNASAVTSDSDLSTCFANATYPGDAHQQVIVPPTGEDQGKRLAWSGALFWAGGKPFSFVDVFDIGATGGLDVTRRGTSVLEGAGDPPRFFRSDPAVFVFGASDIEPGRAAVDWDGGLYVFGTRKHVTDAGLDFRREVFLARVPPANAADRAAYQFFAGRDDAGVPQWSGDATATATLFLGDVNGVMWNPHLGSFLLTYIEPFGEDIWARTAPTPYGPWSDRELVVPCYRPPGATSEFCYDARLHPQLGSADGRDVVLFYDTNAWNNEDGLGRSDVYWPRLVRIRFQ